jgi:hypothetical protein
MDGGKTSRRSIYTISAAPATLGLPTKKNNPTISKHHKGHSDKVRSSSNSCNSSYSRVVRYAEEGLAPSRPETERTEPEALPAVLQAEAQAQQHGGVRGSEALRWPPRGREGRPRPLPPDNQATGAGEEEKVALPPTPR